ncbi:unnamed protein product [Adineta steineri]|uniref:Uncharacterized protein n=1 Tax=Adineta steineri TaxID=433720 RepID=A0A814EPF5_9BILA|nr:unnamed protein product [Adineta steineri]CAF3578375.1 unnamed protein product [Adineta steineri]
MNYQYTITPYIQSAMAQAMHAMMSGGPLPPNCYIVAIPMQQVQHMFPQLLMNYTPNPGGLMMFGQNSSYFGHPYPPPSSSASAGSYPDSQQSNAVVPYSNYYAQGYNQNYSYPPSAQYSESDGSSSQQRKPPSRTNKKKNSGPHSNVYNSSSFDSYMRNLSWSRLFERHHTKEPKKDQAALSYDQKSKSSNKQPSHSDNSSTLSSLTSSSSSSTTSDETIRRVDVSSKPPSGTSSSSKQQTKSSLPFKYSSEFIPGAVSKEQAQKAKKESKVKIDDVFLVKKPPPTPPSSTQPPPPQQQQQQQQ